MDNEERRTDYPDIVRQLALLLIRLERMEMTMQSIMYGDPSGDMMRPGLMTRLDRLEQKAASNRTWITVALTALGGLITDFILRHLK